MPEYTKCPHCGFAVPIPGTRKKRTTRVIAGVPGQWEPTDYQGARKGDEVLLVFGVGKKSQTTRGRVVRKYRGIYLRTIGPQPTTRTFFDVPTVDSATSVFRRVRT